MSSGSLKEDRGIRLNLTNALSKDYTPSQSRKTIACNKKNMGLDGENNNTIKHHHQPAGQHQPFRVAPKNSDRGIISNFRANFSCEEPGCNKQYLAKRNLRKHENSKHGRKHSKEARKMPKLKENGYFCDTCESSIKDRKQYHRHREYHVRKEKRALAKLKRKETAAAKAASMKTVDQMDEREHIYAEINLPQEKFPFVWHLFSDALYMPEKIGPEKMPLLEAVDEYTHRMYFPDIWLREEWARQ